MDLSFLQSFTGGHFRGGHFTADSFTDARRQQQLPMKTADGSFTGSITTGSFTGSITTGSFTGSMTTGSFTGSCTGSCSSEESVELRYGIE